MYMRKSATSTHSHNIYKRNYVEEVLLMTAGTPKEEVIIYLNGSPLRARTLRDRYFMRK